MLGILAIALPYGVLILLGWYLLRQQRRFTQLITAFAVASAHVKRLETILLEDYERRKGELEQQHEKRMANMEAGIKAAPDLADHLNQLSAEWGVRRDSDAPEIHDSPLDAP